MIHVGVSVKLGHNIFICDLEALQLAVQLLIVLGESLAVLFYGVSLNLELVHSITSL